MFNPRRFGMSRFGALLVLLATVASPWIFLFGYSPFHFGHWHQSQPCLVALHGCCFVASTGFLALLRQHDRTALAVLAHPLVIAPAAMGLASLAAMPWALDASTSFLGLPQTGMGCIWFLDMSILAAGGIFATRIGCSRLLRLSALAAASILVTTSMLPACPTELSPLPLQQFAAFTIVGVAPFLLQPYATRTIPRVTAALLVALLLHLTQTKTALYAFVLLFSAVQMADRFRPSPPRSRVLCGLAAIAMPLAATLTLALGTGMGWIPYWYESLHSRMEILRVVGAAFSGSWQRFLTGFGWGGFPEILIAHAPVVSGPLSGLTHYDQGVWEGLREPFFHTFNLFLESALALGVWGALGTLAWFYLAGHCCPRRMRPVALPPLFTLGVLWTTWFEFPSTLPAISLLFVCCAGRSARLGLNRLSLTALVVVALAAQAIAGVAEVRNMAAVEEESRLIRLTTVESLVKLGSPATDPIDRNGYTLSALLDAATLSLEQDPRFAVAFLARLHRARLRLEQGNPTARLQESYARALNLLAHHLPDPAWESARAEYLGSYGRFTRKLMESLPGRSDLGVGYLLWAMEQDPAGRNLAIGEMLARNPDDPVAGYFLGLALERGHEPRREEEARRRIQTAVAHGVGRFLGSGPGVGLESGPPAETWAEANRGKSRW